MASGAATTRLFDRGSTSTETAEVLGGAGGVIANSRYVDRRPGSRLQVIFENLANDENHLVRIRLFERDDMRRFVRRRRQIQTVNQLLDIDQVNGTGSHDQGIGTGLGDDSDSSGRNRRRSPVAVR